MLGGMAKKEFPFDPLRASRLVGRPSTRSQELSQTEARTAPDTLIQALQQASPHSEPRISKEERADLQAVVLDAIETLQPWEHWLLNALLFERMSLREVEHVLGIPKTTVARKRDRILSKLKHELSVHPLVREYLQDDRPRD